MLVIGRGVLRYRRAHRTDERPFRVRVADRIEIPCCTSVSLLGRNGTGKSTLLRALAGLTREIAREEGFRVAWQYGGQESEASLYTTYLSAAPQFLPLTTVREYACLAARYGREPTAAGAAVEDTLMEYGILERVWDREPSALSSGQRKRLGLARVDLQRSPITLLDEPRSNLDIEGVPLVAQLVDRVRSRGGLVIIATHHKEDEDLSSYVLRLSPSTNSSVLSFQVPSADFTAAPA